MDAVPPVVTLETPVDVSADQFEELTQGVTSSGSEAMRPVGTTGPAGSEGPAVEVWGVDAAPDAGPPVGRRTTQLLGWGAGTAVALVGGYLLLAGGRGVDPDPEAMPAPGPRVTLDVRLIPQDSRDPLLPQEYVELGELCPLLLDGSRVLVTFQLVNPSDTGVEILSVVTGIRSSMLHLAGPTRSGRSCGQRETGPDSGVLQGGESRYYTLSYRVPDRCPVPVAVQVAYRVDVNGAEMTTRVNVFGDLTTIPADVCRS